MCSPRHTERIVLKQPEHSVPADACQVKVGLSGAIASSEHMVAQLFVSLLCQLAELQEMRDCSTFGCEPGR